MVIRPYMVIQYIYIYICNYIYIYNTLWLMIMILDDVDESFEGHFTLLRRH